MELHNFNSFMEPFKETVENQTQFISILKEYPVILGKSKKPEAKKKRAKAVLDVKSRLENEMGIIMNESQIYKKINNMKTRVRKRIQGNQKTALSQWEAEFLEYLEGDLNSLSITGITKETDETGVEVPETSDEESEVEGDGENKTNSPKFQESDETKDLSLSELKRMVLLKQLKYYEKAEKLVDIKIKQALSEKS